jgi:deazaflavin-dependent oxidoreductase (nitroreductase family)
MQTNKQNRLAMRVFRGVFRLVVALTAMIAALYLILLGYAPFLRIKWVNEKTRRLTKPANTLLRKIAGTRWGAVYFNLSALTHVGRSSGRKYVTPLSAYPFGDGFLLALAYAPEKTDWYQNVQAAGKCTLKFMGREYALERPEVIPISQALRAYPLLVRPFIWAGETKLFVWLHRYQEAPAPALGKGKTQVSAQ